jgi:hypothetical protein
MKSKHVILVSVALVLLAATMAHAQAVVPTSGAAVTINGGGTNVIVYDSQIHSGTVLPSGCDPAGFKTDADVLQGGSPTGCAPTDSFEITDVATSTATFTARTDNAVHQNSGSRDIAGFHIETHFVCVGKCADHVTGTKTFCNTAGTICINVVNGNPADDGFVVVKNNTGSNFTGTISVQGTSTTGCAAVDSVVGLSSGASVTLAMGTPGTAAVPNTLDSSACGGFNFDQSQTITLANPSAKFIFGKDKFTVNPSFICVPPAACSPTSIISGDTLTLRPVPVPRDLFNLAGGSTLPGAPPTIGAGQQCVSISDFAAPTGANIAFAVCPELQTQSNSVNAETFLWTGELDANLDQNAGYPKDPVTQLAEIGSVHFLGAPALPCPQPQMAGAFTKDIPLSYTGDSTADLPLKPGGSGFNCFVATFVPNTPVVGPGVVAFAFNGFFSPISDTTTNFINPGQNVGLPFDYNDGAGGPPVTTLSWCPGGPSPPPKQNVCLPTAAFPAGAPQPWAAFLRTPTSLPDGCNGTGSASGYIGNSPTNSFLHNFGNGSYKFNWATDPTESVTNNCFTIGVTFDNGTSDPAVATFEVIKKK